MKSSPTASRIESATVCDRGLVRPENQDNHFADSEAGLFAVADGMGGGQGGAQASAIVRETFQNTDWKGDLAARLEAAQRAVEESNAAIAAYARRAGYRQTGSTVAALLLGDAVPGAAFAVWVGDSRVYRVRDGVVTALTNDHTVANELFGRGFGAHGADGYSRSLPYAHVLTRALGVDKTVKPDARRFEALPGDRFLVCSDGVHDMLPADRIGQLLSSAAAPDACVAALAEAVRAAGAVDNFTATVVFLKGDAK